MYELSSLLLMATFSTICRSALNIIDRKQFFLNKEDIWKKSLWNNIVPMLLIFPFLFMSDNFKKLSEITFSYEVLFFSCTIQIVAYFFSYALKNYRVSEVAIISKYADITVPICLYFIGSYLRFECFLLALYFLFFWISIGCLFKNINLNIFSLISFCLVISLTIQAISGYFMYVENDKNPSINEIAIFSIATLLWRLLFSLIVNFYVSENLFKIVLNKSQNIDLLTLLRAVLTIATQFSLLFVMASPNFLIAWPILNSTCLISPIFAYLFLNERIRKSEIFLIFISFFITTFSMIIFSSKEYGCVK
ncbi:hypothetical protein [Polynucleobacter sp. IMCC 30228]|uniref:hypothetical protein n=1 Tax=Polynucleobacter sp. IMCC 30228 TaxID=2781011 RepID=UPI001F29685A|nr:hypothetical protein [Polynucleobacter sp. IMCC 30228]MCE7526846.1 hypothetical protein [Polynucleobacter sp. IMCC 30228]